ncbi:MAG: hypothetical protein ACRD4S_01675 [Candidatus Acidiferrales bacterium]
MNTTTNDPSDFVQTIANAEGHARNASRAGTAGGWCFFCGVDGLVFRCACGFGESFGCGTAARHICADCRLAHGVAAQHLRAMFSARRVDRVNSIRGRAYRDLRIAADGLERGDRLRFHLAQVDSFDSEYVAFRHGILDSFARAQFLDFAGLARGLEQQRGNALLRALVLGRL